jgi:hypothetical protein
MSVSDFINDPFGTVAKAGLDAAPDDVRETLHDVKQQVTDPTMPDGGALIENLGADPGGAGTLGEVTAPESYSLGENTFGGIDTADQIIHPDPYAPPEPPHYDVEVGPAQIIDPEDGTAGEQAQYSGADGYWGTSDYGGSAAEEAAGSGVSAYGPDVDPNYSVAPVGEDGPATPDYGPGATGELAGAGGEVTPQDDSFF